MSYLPSRTPAFTKNCTDSFTWVTAQLAPLDFDGDTKEFVTTVLVRITPLSNYDGTVLGL